ncbi:organic solute transporter Ostalpha-domain-containing protein [Boletus reticuloceps]|uniref:Organic solute transporter Ostalpha-domain-containing protein n=1 Tax=Boletus reticuloceps TaxID=495285 RepID=A0A8I2YFM3_9AGAM|nr:organic solute transporter Ostalpha-domain-containing protein [Boletus reticuloceps]
MTAADIGLGHGSGSSLPLPVLELAGISTVVAVVVSGISISLHLRNYRKPLLQRMVVRIMVMVPLYGVSSFISLFSLEAAFFIDVIRDVYEAFVIYCFFVLLLDYLGGERSLLILLHGRPPIPAVFPVSLWGNEIDPSDPYTFLFLKRGILQYVQVKPLLALASLIMKATGTYNEGDFRARSGYLFEAFPPPASAAGGVPIYVARMTLVYALRDALGLKDLVEDTRATLRGEGINYRAFEPSEGGMHIGAARDHRIRAGLRYAAGGKRKYWLPDGDVTAPLFAADAEDVVHDAPDMQHQRGGARILGDDVDLEDADEYALTFCDALAGPDGTDEQLYEDAKKYVFGDYLYPVVDVSSEDARRAMWDEEERVVREITSGGFGRLEGAPSGYGATQNGKRQARPYKDVPSRGSPRSSQMPRTPSPPRPRRLSDCPPMTAGSRSSSQAHSPSQVTSRLHIPRLSHLLSSSSVSLSVPVSPSAPSSSSSLPSRVSKRLYTPLVQEDAVDLVVPAPDSLQVPSTSRRSHSPVLIRVWDELGSSAVSPVSPLRMVVDEDEERGEEERREEERRRDALDAREEYGATLEVVQEDVTVVRTQTPPPYARVEGYGIGIPEEEPNPWA